MEPADTSAEKFKSLMDRLRCGSTEAVEELMETYGRHVIRAIRRHLSGRIRNQYDSIDFSQAVWGSFFRDSKKVPEFSDPAQLIAYLVRISKNKVIDECRKRLKTQRYDVNREQRASDKGINDDQRLPGNTPTPSAIVTAKEFVEQILENQPESYRNILRLRASGATFAEIAEETGLNERSIRRVIKRLESRAKQ